VVEFLFMRIIVAIILVVGLLSSSFSRLYLFSNYILNKELITKKYCENKSKPKLKCKGKCHLKKQLHEQEEKEGATKNTLKEVNEILLISENNELKLLSIETPNASLNGKFIPSNLPKATHSIFHPPTC